MLVNESDRALLTGVFYQHFLQFRKPFGIYRKKTIAPENGTNLFGYNNEENNFNYEIESGVFSGVRFYPKRTAVNLQDTKTSNATNTTYLRVEEDAYAYITALPIDKISLENAYYNLQTPSPTIQDYLGLKFYVYELERIN